MQIFFDLGLKGAISIFDKQKFVKVIKYQLNNKAKKSCQEKILQFHHLVKNLFSQPSKIKKIGCHKPFGTNRNTIINLALMSCVLIIFFAQSEFVFINEWNSWKEILQKKQIPKREIKKDITIKWVEKHFNLTKINDDEADAILGGYWMSKNKN